MSHSMHNQIPTFSWNHVEMLWLLWAGARWTFLPDCCFTVLWMWLEVKTSRAEMLKTRPHQMDQPYQTGAILWSLWHPHFQRHRCLRDLQTQSDLCPAVRCSLLSELARASYEYHDAWSTSCFLKYFLLGQFLQKVLRANKSQAFFCKILS